MPKNLPPLDEISVLIRYEPETGLFFNEVSRNPAAPKGKVSGSRSVNGYITIRHNRQLYLAHRLAWLFMTGDDPGSMDVDHIDGDPGNNRFLNLRLATRSQNLHNAKRPVTNTSGHKGVYFTRGKWVAYMRIDGKRKHLAACVEFDDAVAIYKRHEEIHRGEFARKEN